MPGTYEELKDVNAGIWKPEIVVAVKEGEVLKIGMLEHKESCRKIYEALKQVFGKDFVEHLSKMKRDLASSHHLKCLIYLVPLGPLLSALLISSANCKLPLEDSLVLKIVIFLACRKPTATMLFLEAIMMLLWNKKIHLKETKRSKRDLEIVIYPIVEGNLGLKESVRELMSVMLA